MRGKTKTAAAAADPADTVEPMPEFASAEAVKLWLSERFARETDPEHILRTAAAAVGTYLGAARVGYGEFDADTTWVSIPLDWTRPGVDSMAGVHRFYAESAVGGQLVRGRMVVAEDIAATRRPDEPQGPLASAGADAAVIVPLVHDGRLVAVFAASDNRPRAWAQDEIALISQTGARIWGALQHLRLTEQLRASEEQFRLMAENLPGICWVGDRDAKPLWGNRRWHDLYDTTAAAHGDASGVVHPDDFARGRAIWQQMRAEGTPGEYQVRLKGADGIYRPFLSKAAPIHDAAGAVTRWVGVQIDLSDQHAQNRRQLMLRSFYDATRALTDPAAILAVMSRLVVAHLDVSYFLYFEAAEAGARLAILDSEEGSPFAGPDRAALDVAFEALANRPNWTETRVIDDEAASDRPVDEPIAIIARLMKVRAGINVPIVKDDRRVAAMTVLDTSPRQWSSDEIALVEELAEALWAAIARARAEAATAEREQQFRTLAENTPALCWLGDAGGRVYWMNGPAEAFFGPIGLRTELALTVHPDDMDRAAAAWSRALTVGEPLSMTLQLRGASDEYRPFRSSTTPIHDAAGRLTGWCGTMIDLTEREAHARRQVVLRAFSDRTRDLADRGAIIAELADILDRNFGISHFLYVEADTTGAERLDLLRASLGDRLDRLDPPLIEAAITALSERPDWDRPRVIGDNLASEHPQAGPVREVAERLGVRAGVNVPVLRDGRLVAILCILDEQRRDWSEDEVALAEELAERLWAAMARVRAERALVERERNQAFLITWTDRTRELTTPDAIIAATMEMLAERLAVTRATYSVGDATGRYFDIRGEWRDAGVISIAGTGFSLDDVGDTVEREWLSGELVRYDDIATDPRIEDAVRGAYLSADIHAFVSVPLIENGRVRSALSVQHQAPRGWQPSELELLRDVADRIWVAIERARAETELQERERNQAFLIDWTDRVREERTADRIVAITLARLGEYLGVSRTTYSLGDESGEVLTNRGEWANGVVSVADTVWRLTDVDPEVRRQWLLGQPIHYDDIPNDPRITPARREFFESVAVRSLITIPLIEAGRVRSALSLQSQTARRWTEGEIQLLCDVAERTWVVLERARAEAELQERERNQAFLIDWSDRIRGETEPAAIVATTLEAVGQYLGVARATFADLNDVAGEHTFEVTSEWRTRVASLLGNRFTLASVGAAVDRNWHAGESICYADVADDPRLEPAAVERYVARQIRAFISVPLVAGGAMQSALSIQSDTPRAWSEGEVQLLRDVAERTWVALERAKAQAALAERSQHQAFLVAWSDAVRGETGARAILARTVRMVADYMGVSRVNYAEPDAAFATMTVIEEHHGPDVVGVKGATYKLEEFGAKLAADQRSGAPVRIEDTATDDRFDDHNRPLFDAIDVRAALTVSMRRGEETLATLSLQDSTPRRWTDAEVELVRELADRTLSVLERAQSEARLAESEAQLSAFMENAPVAMNLRDAKGRYIRLNPEFGRAVSRPVEEVTGLTPHDIFPPHVAAQLSAMHERAMCGEVVSAELLEGDEKYHSVLTIAFPIGDGQGAAKTAGFTIDLSERKKAEAALQRSRDTLYQTEKLTALGSLLAGVSHELNNPLSIVVAQAVMMERQSQGTELAERAQKIRKAADRCARIVQSFLAMARQKRPEREAADLNAIAIAAHELADYGLKNDGIATLRALAPGLPPISADSDQLHQIVINLIVNAQQAMVEAGVADRRLTLRSGPGEAPGTVFLEVSDSGPGIPLEVQRRIFEPFYTTKPQGQGTGVGLSFSQGLAEAHGGTLELVPTKQGACFRLTLPIDGDAAAAAPAPQLDLTQPAPPRRALVVDDEREIAESLADFLSIEGYTCEIAEGGVAAQARLADGDYDLIVSDLRMPDLDGPRLHAWVAEHRPDLAQRMAFATGDTLGQTAARFLSEFKRPVLEKPFTPEAVRRFLEQMDLA